MKAISLALLALVLAGPLAIAEEGAPPAPTAEQEIERAFQREYAYLAAQREALARQRQKVASKTSADIVAAKKIAQELGARLARLQSENDSLFANVQDAERIRREERNREDQLLVAWKKAKRALEENRLALRFEGGKPEIDLLPPEKLAVADLVRLGTEGIALAETGSRLVRFKGTYLDQNDRLVDSTLFRLGRVAVFAETADGVKLLGPVGKGALRAVEDDKDGNARSLLEKRQVSSVPVYLFESLQDRLSVKKPAGITDRIADMVPLVFLGLLFLMVAFLFSQLAKV
jgi:biopolymer transport protein ExbB